jgi:hypothetical protein
MIRSTWGPLLAGALELVATGRLNLSMLGSAEPAALDDPWELDKNGVIWGAGPMPSASPRMAGVR